MLAVKQGKESGQSGGDIDRSVRLRIRPLGRSGGDFRAAIQDRLGRERWDAWTEYPSPGAESSRVIRAPRCGDFSEMLGIAL